MSYSVNIWMEDGEPRLGVIHAETGDVQLQWRLNRIVDSAGQARTRQPPVKGKTGMQQLLRALFLVSCAQEISLMRRLHHGGVDESCLRCERCGESALDLTNLSDSYTE